MEVNIEIDLFMIVMMVMVMVMVAMAMAMVVLVPARGRLVAGKSFLVLNCFLPLYSRACEAKENPQIQTTK